MEQSKIIELKKKIAERYKGIHDSFEIGQRVETVTDAHEPDITLGADGIVVNKIYSEHGCDLRVDFAGYETWIDAEDVC